jgi:hypothetical protein
VAIAPDPFKSKRERALGFDALFFERIMPRRAAAHSRVQGSRSGLPIRPERRILTA